jgi:hypothetical protein
MTKDRQPELTLSEQKLDQLVKAGYDQFGTTWRDPDESGHAEPVTVLGLATTDERRGILLNVERGDKQRRLLADQVWADDESSANAIVLNDYRYWVYNLHGLTPGFD